MIKCRENDAVTLYYSNAAKLDTNAGGVTVTGEVTATLFDGILDGGISLKHNAWHQDDHSTPKNRLYFAADSHTYYGSGNKHFWQNTSGATVLQLDASGNLTATANVTAYSDERLKSDISEVRCCCHHWRAWIFSLASPNVAP